MPIRKSIMAIPKKTYNIIFPISTDMPPKLFAPNAYAIIPNMKKNIAALIINRPFL